MKTIKKIISLNTLCCYTFKFKQQIYTRKKKIRKFKKKYARNFIETIK